MKTVIQIALFLFILYWVFNLVAWGFKKIVVVSLVLGVVYLIGRYFVRRSA
ncbi:MAG: hypothetical protein NW226_25990 [Microscillaceae bacterium]|nr:hypothetical protein [Microscillaceae bacterium]